MYQNKLVAAIKVHGQILRETPNHSVAVPFGSEYAVYVKNLNAVRVQVKISVDGTDATSNNWLVVPPNSAIELERFIRDGNWESGNRFKFIERTAGIEKHRGIKADDGLVRIEYQTEHVRPVVDVPIPRYYDEWHPVPRPYYPPRWPYRPFYGASRSAMRTNSLGASASSGHSQNVNYTHTNDTGFEPFEPCAVEDSCEVGITVPGSQSYQRFVQAESFPTGASEVMVLHLRGVVAGKAVKQAVTVKTKTICATCGASHKAGIDYCSGCGTALRPI